MLPKGNLQAIASNNAMPKTVPHLTNCHLTGLSRKPPRQVDVTAIPKHINKVFAALRSQADHVCSSCGTVHLSINQLSVIIIGYLNFERPMGQSLAILDFYL